MNAAFIKLRWQSHCSSPTSMTIRLEEAVFAQGPGQFHFSDASGLEERSTELFGSKARAAQTLKQTTERHEEWFRWDSARSAYRRLSAERI